MDRLQEDKQDKDETVEEGELSVDGDKISVKKMNPSSTQ